MTDEPIQLDYRNPARRAGPLDVAAEQGAARQVIGWVLRTFAWTVFGTFALFAVLGAIATVTGPFVAAYGAVSVVVLVPTLALASRAVRRRRAAAVVGYLAQAVRLNLPLTRALITAARGEPGRAGRRLLALAGQLEAGAPLADAMARSVPELPTRDAGLILFAERVGQLGQTLDRLVDDHLVSARRARADRAMAAWYPPLVLLIGGTCVFLLSTFVFPKYAMLCRDLRVPLPWATRAVMAVADAFWPVLPALLCAMLVLVGNALQEVFRIRRRTWFIGALADRATLVLPVYGRLFRDRQWADVCTALAAAVELGHPLGEALLRSQDLDLNGPLRRGLGRWAAALGAGESPSEAARMAALPHLVVGLLATAANVADIAPALRFAARFYTGRWLKGNELVRATYLPIVTGVMGVMVAVVALGVFLPIQRLLENLSHAGPQ